MKLWLSDYSYVTPGFAALAPDGCYTIDTDPSNSINTTTCIFGDHTTGFSYMMVVIGDANTSSTVWQGTTIQDLLPGQVYKLQAWVANLSSFVPAMLTLYVVGVNLGTITVPGHCSWQPIEASFIASSLRPTLRLVNAQSTANGNDFTIDDINVILVGSPEIDVQRLEGTYISDVLKRSAGSSHPRLGQWRHHRQDHGRRYGSVQGAFRL